MAYYSQFREDEWIERNLAPPVGVFCEVGAYDGRECSNTLHFEEAGWTGTLIEPNPLMASRCAINRKSRVVQCAIGTVQRPFFICDDTPLASGFNSTGRLTVIPVRRLDEIITGQLDLLSVDVEGTELDVISSMGNLRPSIVIVEYKTYNNPPTDSEIIAAMAALHYREVHRTTCNLIFIL